MIIYIILAVILFSWWLYTKTRLSKKEREVIQGCIKHYEAVIQIAEVSDNWENVIRTNKLESGLCYYLITQGIPERLQKWIKKVPNTYKLYWYKTLYSCNTRHEAIEALQYRVDKMKQLLKKY